jgi:uncharacterized protein GlcG (DUF336 family)
MKFAFMLLLSLGLFGTVAQAAPANGCKDLPTFVELKKALTEARKAGNGGLNLDMWGTLVDRSGVVCAVAFTGAGVGDQWPGSRVISAQKANTANAFSLPKSALSTGNLYSGTQPGGFLFGLGITNPVNTAVAYAGEAAAFGTDKDPMMGERIGGVNVFGGGLALYNAAGILVGGLGVSGDTSCADHNIAWRTRAGLKLDVVPGGVAKDKSDQIIYDIHTGKSVSGFGHPNCGMGEDKIVKDLPKVRALRAK